MRKTLSKTLAMLVATTALTAVSGLPGQTAVRGHDDGETRALAATPDAVQAPPVMLARNDAGGDDDDGEDEGEDEDEDGGEDDDDDCAGGAGVNPAPSGPVPPPRNGLFGDGAAPTVRVN